MVDQPKSKVGAFQVGPKGKDSAVGQKEKMGVIPRSKSTGQVFHGADSAKQKPQTGAVQPFKGKLQVQEPKVLQKEKLSVTPRSQSAGQMQIQGVGSDKNKVQTQSVQPFKGKAKDWGSSAGSSGPIVR